MPVNAILYGQGYTREEVDTDLATKAPLASPSFTGTPTAPTAAAKSNNSQIATTAYVDNAAIITSDTSTSGLSNGVLTVSSNKVGQRNITDSATEDSTALITSGGVYSEIEEMPYINADSSTNFASKILVGDSTNGNRIVGLDTLAATNWNNNIMTGFYRGSSNAPVSSTDCSGIVIAQVDGSGTRTIAQTVWPTAGGKSYTRKGTKTSSATIPTWTTWTALTASDVGAKGASDVVPITQGGTGKTTAAAALTALGGVPTTRTVNSKTLSQNISLTASDVGAVPITRTVNKKALSQNISLTAGDVGAATTSHTHGVATGGTGVTSFTTNSLIMSGNTTTAALTTRAITNNTSDTTIATGTDIPTMNTIYHGLAKINNVDQSRATTIYAPTGAGTSGNLLVAQGSNTAPTWTTLAGAGVAAASHNHAASAINSGTLPVARGGTGLSTMSYPNAVLIGNSSTVTSAMQAIKTANGAFYATDDDGKPGFGTLPAAQGGTGYTSLQAARNAMGLGNTTGALPIANGGTGATNISGALSALNAMSTTRSSVKADTAVTNNKAGFFVSAAEQTIASQVVYINLPASADSASTTLNGQILIDVDGNMRMRNAKVSGTTVSGAWERVITDKGFVSTLALTDLDLAIASREVRFDGVTNSTLSSLISNKGWTGISNIPSNGYSAVMTIGLSTFAIQLVITNIQTATASSTLKTMFKRVKSSSGWSSNWLRIDGYT